jgi:hypothetical protein
MKILLLISHYLFVVCMLVLFSAQAKNTDAPIWRYSVRPGDTLVSITKEHLQSPHLWKNVASYNNISGDYLIWVGQQLRIPVAWLRRTPAPALLVSLSGEVQVLEPDQTWRKARLWEELPSGTQVKVGRNSSAKLQFADTTSLIMQPDTALVLDRLSTYAGRHMADTQMRLKQGRIEVIANPRNSRGQIFEVVTPSAIAAVRGTRFIVQLENNQMIEQTLQGIVSLETKFGQLSVLQGFGSVVSEGAAPLPPERLLPPPSLGKLPSLYTSLPITVPLNPQEQLNQWVFQLGHDPEMAQLIKEFKTNLFPIDLGGLANGVYYLRAWQVDLRGIPTLAANHTFSVQVPRQLQGPAIRLEANMFTNGSLGLELPSLPDSKRYGIQLTQDLASEEVLWEKFNPTFPLFISQPANQSGVYYLWIWIY